MIVFALDVMVRYEERRKKEEGDDWVDAVITEGKWLLCSQVP